MNTLTKVVVAVFCSNVVKCEVGEMFLTIKVRLRILDPILKFIKRFLKEVKSSQIDLNVYNLLNKVRSTTQGN